MEIECTADVKIKMSVPLLVAIAFKKNLAEDWFGFAASDLEQTTND